MDIKTLPTILCYVSSATTLNTYSHITDEMQQLVAEKIDRDNVMISFLPFLDFPIFM